MSERQSQQQECQESFCDAELAAILRTVETLKRINEMTAEIANDMREATREVNRQRGDWLAGMVPEEML